MSQWIPNLIHPDRDCRNGHVPSAHFYGEAVAAENYLTGHGDRMLFQRQWLLGNGSYGFSGTTTVARFRFRTRYGAARVRACLVILKSSSGFGPADPNLDVVVTEVGVGSTTYAFRAVVDPIGGDDKPEDWRVVFDSFPVTADAEYTVAINLYDYARLAACEFHEVGEPTVSEATDYYNAMTANAGAPILDTTRSRLLVGLSNMYRRNGGTICHWGKFDGSAATRTSATAINLMDNTTTGAPTAATPGWYLDMSYRNTQSRPTSVPFELAVYGSVAGGSGGTVTMVNSSGTTLATVTVTGAAGWYTATGTISTTAGKFDLQFAGDGTNQLSVYAVSFLEWES